LYETFLANEQYFIMLPYMGGGELFYKICEAGHFSEKEARRVLTQIARGMEYLHSQGVIHRDLKPGNVLVCSLDPSCSIMCKITDFGEARDIGGMAESMSMTAGIGTPYYMAPEMMSNTKHYSKSIDVFSFGIMAAHVLNGKLVYEGDPEFDSIYAFAMLVSQGLRPVIGECSEDLKQLIKDCWDTDPSKRPSFETVVSGFRMATMFDSDRE